MSTWNEVGERVYVHRYAWLALTIGAVVGDDGVLIIDTGDSHRQARELIDDLATLTDLPVRWVVNTHYHWDHCWGNALFRTAELWGHENTRLELLEHGEDARRRVIGLLPVEHHDAIRAVEIVPPEHTFSDRVSIDIGRAVDLRYHGPGHTNSDISVAVDEVLFAGDLVEEAGPPAFGDAYPLDWPAALDGLLGYVHGPVVPGHGRPVDRAFVEHQRADIAVTVELARAGFEGHVPMSEVDVEDAPFSVEVSRSVVERTYAQLTGDL
ncbi:MAG: MBL fold metallo-hydrolase [Acidimicrobiia bacterium]|nr:MBL fold metallo-hydrolase [Acidimicrobiia bacterium]